MSVRAKHKGMLLKHQQMASRAANGLMTCSSAKLSRAANSTQRSSAHGMQGVKNAVPKTILQLMNVEGMTRENVASHLQKYRQYLKRMAGYPANVKVTHDDLQKIQQVRFLVLSMPSACYMAPPGKVCLPGGSRSICKYKDHAAMKQRSFVSAVVIRSAH